VCFWVFPVPAVATGKQSASGCVFALSLSHSIWCIYGLAII
jgi:hypothetical protein